MYHFIFNDINCMDMGVLVVRRPNVPVPYREQIEYAIPGRDGVILSKASRLEPIDFSMSLNFMADDADSFGHRFREVKRWLTGSGTLYQSDDLDWFYNVYSVSIPESERTSRKIGAFTADFRCDPYMYAAAGNRFMDSSECLFNPYNECHPIYYVSASDSWTLTVNSNTFTGSAGEIYIDTDKMIAYDDSETLINTSVVGDYADFYLVEGENTISLSTGTLEVKPRWRSL